MAKNALKLFLRLSISFGFLSAVADRFGFCSAETSTWGNWENFLEFTMLINPWFPDALIPAIGTIATSLEVLFAVLLILGLKTELVAKLSGTRLLLFALSMSFSLGIKSALTILFSSLLPEHLR